MRGRGGQGEQFVGSGMVFGKIPLRLQNTRAGRPELWNEDIGVIFLKFKIRCRARWRVSGATANFF